jgi:hypothetical protein
VNDVSGWSIRTPRGGDLHHEVGRIVSELTDVQHSLSVERLVVTDMNPLDENPNQPVARGPVAGEAIKDAARWPGYVLIGIGMLAFALSLTALAVGRATGAATGGVVTVVAVAAGIAWQVLERRRVRRGLPAGTPERPEDIAPLNDDA